VRSTFDNRKAWIAPVTKMLPQLGNRPERLSFDEKQNFAVDHRSTQPRWAAYRITTTKLP